MTEGLVLGVPDRSDADFVFEAIPALREAGEKGLTLMELRAAMFTGEGWTPRQMRGLLLKLEEDRQVRCNNEPVGPRYYAA